MLAVLRLSRLPAAEGKRTAAAQRNRDTSAPLDSRVRGPVAETGLDAPAQRDGAGEALEPADELAIWA
jgi:hypothetical protein